MRKRYKTSSTGLLIALVAYLLMTACQTVADLPVEELNTKYRVDPYEYIQIDGMAVHYRAEGPENDSVPVVLLHGTGSSL